MQPWETITQPNTRDQALDGIRGAAILLVMLGHCIVLNGLDQTDPILYDIIRSVQMPLFILISGILAAGGRLRLTKLGKRAQSYLLPFFSWFAVSYFWARIRDSIRGQKITLSAADFFTELKELLFQTDRGLWFFMTLFVITLLMSVAAELARKFCKESIAATVLIAGALYGLIFLQARSGNTFLSPALTLQYMPFYVLGYLRGSVMQPAKQSDAAEGGKGIYQKMEKIEPLLTAVCMLLFLALVIRYPLSQPAASAKELFLQMLASLIGTVGIFGLLYRGRISQRMGKVLGLLAIPGVYTSEIYVLHFRFARLLRIGERADTIWSLQGMLWLLFAFLLMSVLTAAFILILNRIPLCRYLLFGKRKEQGDRKTASKP